MGSRVCPAHEHNHARPGPVDAMPASHSRKPSAQHQSVRPPALHTSQNHTTLPRSRIVNTSESPSLLRLPSTGSFDFTFTRSRRATNPSTPSLTQASPSTTTTSPSYFSPQTSASGTEPRSPGSRRPPASFSGHGIDTSRGPPITLITRGNSDIARRTSQQPPSEPVFPHHQSAQQGLLSPRSVVRGSSQDNQQRKSDSERPGDPASTNSKPTSLLPQAPARPILSRRNSTASSRHEEHMDRSVDVSSDYTSGLHSRYESRFTANGRRGPQDGYTADGAQEDLFLNIAADSASKETPTDAAARSDRLKSRIARAAQRQSAPSAPFSSSAFQSISTPTNGNSRIPSAVDTKVGTPYRRASLLPSARTSREQTPLTPTTSTETRAQVQDLSPKRSFTTQRKDSDLSPKEFLAQLENGRRQPSYSDSTQTPPNRTNAYRPSNLHYYSASREDPQTPLAAPAAAEPASSRADGTESHGSTGPATSVWDELDELKSRIRRIEMGGKIPATSSAVISQATADRPRTANTSTTTVSSSPNQKRKPNPSPSESTVGIPTPSKIHPLLGEALAKAKQHTPPSVYRVLEATASEALSLAEMTGSTGPQGTFHSASSILNGSSVPDRQVRRKADNICRSLTELCITLCDKKPSLSSPAFRSVTVPSRRSSVQVNDSPTIRPSIEPESNTQAQSSPSTAMSRIEARRVSMMAGGTANIGSTREPSQEPLTPSQLNMPSRVNRAGTSLNRTRQNADEEDDDPTLRAPSRAFTDFRDFRPAEKSRYSRTYTSREPMPDLQPSAIQPSSIQPSATRPSAVQSTTSLRRPTVPGLSTENLLLRDDSRRYGIERQTSPAYEKQIARELTTPRTQFSSNRHSVGGITGLGRSGSLNRRLRGKSAGE
ncbi:hypothetical protein DM02DRAFT_616451 [Periconia macrospinosa]|uniref:Uncharacterized protein n=1 Tax=Periconia macrospinosa TaxID=97972 RepID=A0A2V1DHE4_9PLEO|nr:hypothetical protein DM02DRAFT_616451 [Periconia macrospinosa]